MRLPPPPAAAAGPAASDAVTKRRRRTRALLLVPALVALGIAASLVRGSLGDRGPSAAELAATRDAEVAAAIDRMSAASGTGDEAAFVAVADPLDTALRARLS